MTSTLEELDACHLRHAVIRQDEGYGKIAPKELVECRQCLRPGYRPDDPVPLGIPRPKVTGNGLGDRHVIIDGENDRSRHAVLLLG